MRKGNIGWSEVMAPLSEPKPWPVEVAEAKAKAEFKNPASLWGPGKPIRFTHRVTHGDAWVAGVACDGLGISLERETRECAVYDVSFSQRKELVYGNCSMEKK
jgi:hypothetical protein